MGNVSFMLYDINKQFAELIEDENSINQETGELTLEASEKMKALDIQREDLIHYIGLSHFNYKAEVEKVNSEIERLEAIKKSFQVKENSLRRLLEKTVRVGEDFKFSNLQIKWQKNPPSVETDLELNLEELHNQNPELVSAKTVYSLDKAKIKEMKKEDKPLPKGIRVIQSNSMRIK